MTGILGAGTIVCFSIFFLFCSSTQPSGYNLDKQGRATLPQEAPMRVSASIARLSIKKVRDGGENEIYVVGMVADNREVDGNEGDMTTDSTSKFKWSTAVSVVFKKIKDKQSLSLSGDGIILYPNRDPQGALGICFTVMEQDQKRGSSRESAQFLENIGENLDKIDPSISGLLTSAIESIVRHFRKDDVLFTHCHSGISETYYGINNDKTDEQASVYKSHLVSIKHEEIDGMRTQHMTFANEKVEVVLKLMVGIGS